MSCAGESSYNRSGEDTFDRRHFDLGLRVLGGNLN